MSATNALTSISGTNGYQQHVDIDPGQPLLLSVTNASGEVTVNASDQPGVWVIVRRSDGQSSEEFDQIPVVVNVNGNTISVHPDWALAGGLSNLAQKIKEQLQKGFNANDWSFSNLRLNPDLNYDMRVQIPNALAEQSKVNIKTASGRVTVRDVPAAVSVVTASGSAAVANITGTTSVHTASGSITVENVVGSLEANTASGSISVTGGEAWTALRTVSGAIRVNESTMKNARVQSVSGSVKVHATADNSENYAFETVSGSVDLTTTLPANAQSQLTFRSISGSGSAGGDWVAQNKRTWVAGSGESGPAFSVKTVSGSLSAQARCTSGLTPRHEPLPPVVPPDVEAGPGSGMNGEPNDLERTVEAATAWVKDFAKGLHNPHQPSGPPPHVPPVPPIPPAPQVWPGHHQGHAPTQQVHHAPADPATPVTPPTSEPAETPQTPVTPPSPETPRGQDASWTWSSGSGSQPPVGQVTSPIVTPPPSPEAIEGDASPASAEASIDSERLRVLEALERGEIDIDEALSRLDSGDETSR